MKDINQSHKDNLGTTKKSIDEILEEEGNGSTAILGIREEILRTIDEIVPDKSIESKINKLESQVKKLESQVKNLNTQVKKLESKF